MQSGEYTARASLALGNCQWSSTSVTSELMVMPAAPFAATMTVLNDLKDQERLVPLWAVYGVARDPRAASVDVNMPGLRLPRAQNNGAFLVLHQGLIDGHARQDVTLTVYNATGHRLREIKTKGGP